MKLLSILVIPLILGGCALATNEVGPSLDTPMPDVDRVEADVAPVPTGPSDPPDTTPCDPLTQPSCQPASATTTTTTVPYVPCDLDRVSCGTLPPVTTPEPCDTTQPSCQD